MMLGKKKKHTFITTLLVIIVFISWQPQCGYAAIDGAALKKQKDDEHKQALEDALNHQMGDEGSNPAFWSDPIITAKQVLEAMKEGKGPIRFLDATWFNEPDPKPRWRITQWIIKKYQKLTKKVPKPVRNGTAEYETEHIKGALFWDMEKISKRPSYTEASETEPAMQIWMPHDHMIPDVVDFIGNATALGLHYKDAVVIYNQKDCYGAPRLWYIFKVFGHSKVYVLNGGLEAWKAAGGETESGPAPQVQAAAPSPYKALFKKTMVVDQNQVVTNALMAYHNMKMRPNAPWILDARPKDRFEGTAKEPRLDCEPGHIPNSLNLPFTEVLKEGDVTRFKSAAKIKEAFQAAGVDIDKLNGLEKPLPIVHISGSGVMAAVNFIAAAYIGRDIGTMTLYDAGYAEWGADEDRAHMKGPAGVAEAKAREESKKREEERHKQLLELKVKKDKHDAAMKAKEEAAAAAAGGKEKEEEEKKAEL